MRKIRESRGACRVSPREGEESDGETAGWNGVLERDSAGGGSRKSVTYLLYELQLSWVADGINKLES